ncbi:MAG: BatD family protein [Paludibacteraceae bacterium]|nr:BatD family protein [Paludibacteraceae bacterium]
MFKLLLAIIVSATIDSTTLFLGDQTALRLEAVAPKEERVQMPVYGKYLIPGIEIVKRTGVDSTQLKDGRVQLRQTLTITSFQDSLFAIPPIVFYADGDTLYSQPLMLNVVQPFELDSTAAITDIKPIQKAPVWVWGIVRWIMLLLILLLMCAGIYYLLKHVRDGRDKRRIYIPKEPERPAEEVALEKLDAIREEKIWQAGREKDYHTQLTDVVREYIGKRFDVHSTEKTSNETLREMKTVLKNQKELYTGLSQMLQLADLIKFAKWKATPDENERSLQTAYQFVKETTPLDEPKKEDKP